MIRVVIYGIHGRVGSRIASLIQQEKNVELIAGLGGNQHRFDQKNYKSPLIVANISDIIPNAFDVVIDFSTPSATEYYLPFLIANKKPIVIGTTGFSEEKRKNIIEASHQIPICLSSNMSVGVNILFKLVSEAAQLLGNEYDAEVIEAHHSKKKDSPSGTAKSIGEVLLKAYETIGLKRHLRYERNGADCLRDHEEIGMQTIRGGDIVGDHAVIFAGLGERLEIKHQATNRDLFAKGAIRAAKWLVENKKGQPGLYDMQDVLGIK